MDKKLFKEKVNAVINSMFPEKEENTELEQTATPTEEETKIEMASYTLEDGRVIEYEALEVGNEIYVIPEEGDPMLLEDGNYTIDGKIVTMLEGKISEVVDVEPEEEVAEPSEEMKTQLKSEIETQLKAEYETKLEADKAAIVEEYETKMKDEKEKIKAELTKLSEEAGKSIVTQAPVEEKNQKPLTKKELILKEIDEKIKDKNN